AAMSADPLDLFVVAYRSETAHRDRDARAVRARVIATAGTRRKGRRFVVWLCAATILFAGSAALAAGGGQRVARLIEWLQPQAAQTKVTGEHAPRRARPAVAPAAQAPAPPARAANTDDPSSRALPLSALPVDAPHAATNRRAAP